MEKLASLNVLMVSLQSIICYSWLQYIAIVHEYTSEFYICIIFLETIFFVCIFLLYIAIAHLNFISILFFWKLFFLFVFVHILGKMQKGDQARGSRNINWNITHFRTFIPLIIHHSNENSFNERDNFLNKIIGFLNQWPLTIIWMWWIQLGNHCQVYKQSVLHKNFLHLNFKVSFGNQCKFFFLILLWHVNFKIIFLFIA